MINNIRFYNLLAGEIDHYVDELIRLSNEERLEIINIKNYYRRFLNGTNIYQLDYVFKNKLKDYVNIRTIAGIYFRPTDMSILLLTRGKIPDLITIKDDKRFTEEMSKFFDYHKLLKTIMNYNGLIFDKCYINDFLQHSHVVFQIIGCTRVGDVGDKNHKYFIEEFDYFFSNGMKIPFTIGINSSGNFRLQC